MTFATVSVASIASSSRSKMSFQRITTIGSMPLSNSDGDRLADDAVALVLEPVDLDREVGEMSPKLRSRGSASAIWRDASSRTWASRWDCSIGASIL